MGLGAVRCEGCGRCVDRQSPVAVVQVKLPLEVPRREGFYRSLRVDEGVVRQETDSKVWEGVICLPRYHRVIVWAKHSRVRTGPYYIIAGPLNGRDIDLRGPRSSRR